MIGKFIGIQGTSDQITLWIEDLDTHQVSEINSDYSVFFEQVMGVFPDGKFRQELVSYQVSEEGMLTQFELVNGS
jgi:hypothetical protein